MTQYMISITAEANFNKIIEADTKKEANALLKEAIGDIKFLDEEVGCDLLLSINNVTSSEIEKLDE